MKKITVRFMVITFVLFMFSGIGAAKAYAAELSSVEIVSEPKLKDYIVGEPFNIEGLKVKAHYSDGTNSIVNNAELTFKSGSQFSPGYAFKEAGQKTVWVTYGNKSASYEIRVLSKESGRWVCLDPNKGKGKRVTMLLDISKYYPIPKQKFKKAGYSFIGWSTSKKTPASKVTPAGASPSSLKFKSNGTTMVYAQWTKTRKYKVSYVLGSKGVSLGKAVKSYKTGSTRALPYPQAKEGYIFIGWYTGTGKKAKLMDDIKSNTTGNLKLYARYQKYQFQG